MDILNWLGTLPGAIGQGFVWGIAAIGIYITFKILDVADLTVDGSITTGAAVCTILLTNGVNIWLAMLAAFLAGLIAGLVTGLLHTLLGIPAILAGILTQLMLWSVNLVIMSSRANVAISRFQYGDKVLISTGTSNIVKTLLILLGIIMVVSAALYWFFGTEYGCSLRAVGANQQMARAQGINTGAGKLIGLMISNGRVAFSGALMAQYQGFSDVSMGRGAIVIGLAAVIIGEVIFGKLFRNFALKLLAVSLGAIIYYLVIQVVLWLGLNTDDLKLLTALVVALFLAMPYWKNRFASRKLKGGALHG